VGVMCWGKFGAVMIDSMTTSPAHRITMDHCIPHDMRRIANGTPRGTWSSSVRRADRSQRGLRGPPAPARRTHPTAQPARHVEISGGRTWSTQDALRCSPAPRSFSAAFCRLSSGIARVSTSSLAPPPPPPLLLLLRPASALCLQLSRANVGGSAA